MLSFDYTIFHKVCMNGYIWGLIIILVLFTLCKHYYVYTIGRMNGINCIG